MGVKFFLQSQSCLTEAERDGIREAQRGKTEPRRGRHTMAPSQDMDVGQVRAGEGQSSVGEDGTRSTCVHGRPLSKCFQTMSPFRVTIIVQETSSDQSGFFYCSASLFNVAEGGRGSLRSGVTLLWVGRRKKRDEREK